jgi:hypothetical protein
VFVFANLFTDRHVCMQINGAAFLAVGKYVPESNSHCCAVVLMRCAMEIGGRCCHPPIEVAGFGLSRQY